jgi:hypothetical protein
MSRIKSFRFRPGSLESIQLRMWAVPRRHESHPSQVKAQAIGVYRVYCGQGWEHLVGVDEQHTFDLERPADEVDRQLAQAWRRGDGDVAADAAAQLVEWALDDWIDPCRSEDEEW